MKQTYFIEIPEKIKKKLPDGSYVYAILDKIKSLMKENNYFPEYTFHDATHIENVLNEMWVHSPPLGAQANFNRTEKHDTM